MSRFATSLVIALLATTVFAQQPQSTYVYFSTRFSETPASGNGGFISDLHAATFPTPQFGAGYVNEAVAMNSPGVAVVRPGVPNKARYAQQVGVPGCPNNIPCVTDFVEVVNFPQLNVICGDTDNDGLYNETANFAGVDALYIPFVPEGRAVTIHEMFVSTFSDSVGTGGYRGAAIKRADMVLFPASTNLYPLPSIATQPIFFIRQADLEVFFGMAPGTGNTMNTDGFAVDQSNGDIYISFDGQTSSNATAFSGAGFFDAPGSFLANQPVLAGEVFRIPGSAYTPSGPYGIVTNPIANLVQRVYNAADVLAMVTLANGGTTPILGVSFTNMKDMDVNYTTSAPNLTPRGFTIRHLWFNVDSRGPSLTAAANPRAAAIYDTQNGGSFATINGVTMNTPNAAGYHDVSFSNVTSTSAPGFWAGPMDALDIVDLQNPWDPVLGNPIHLDAFPDSGYTLNGTTPTQTIFGYAAGVIPGSALAIFMRADLKVPGGFIDRYSAANLSPVNGFPDLYMDILGINNPSFLMAPAFLAPFGQDPFVASLFNGGPATNPFNWNPLVTFTDAAGANNGDTAFSLNLAPLIGIVPFGFVLTFQALDLGNFRLSDPLSFDFN